MLYVISVHWRKKEGSFEAENFFIRSLAIIEFDDQESLAYSLQLGVHKRRPC